MKPFMSLMVIATMMATLSQGMPVVKRDEPVVAITSPLEGATLQKNQQVTITWDLHNELEKKTVEDDGEGLTVELYRGDPTKLQMVRTLAESVDINDDSAQITIPQDLENGNDYALAVGSNADNMNYIGKLTINDGTASPAPPTAANAPVPATQQQQTKVAAASINPHQHGATNPAAPASVAAHAQQQDAPAVM
ncbi:hypothetical protein BC940DRAFT_370889 [Gongronella butleri]|nr:hypothetical protein BC940DRAFT_370889 [Gongronella butleri]